MAKKSRSRAAGRATSPGQVEVTLTQRDAVTLARIARYYERSWGPARFIIRFTGGSEVRRKLRFIHEESKWLAEFAEAIEADMRELGTDAVAVPLTPRALIAYWGRLLASVNTPRSRRKLTAGEIAHREKMILTLGNAARRLQSSEPRRLEEELATRRPREADWMRAQLAGEAAKGLSAEIAPGADADRELR